MVRQWKEDELMNMTRAFQPACVIMAAAELGVFNVLDAQPGTAESVANALDCDVRGTTILLDALAGLKLLDKRDGVFSCAGGVSGVLTGEGPDSQLAMARHLANCMRRWGDLARVVRDGKPAERRPSILGPDGDTRSFIEAMDDVCRRVASPLVNALDLPAFSHVLDVGCGPATWTIAFLQRNTDTVATLFDLPDVIPIAQRHVRAAGLDERARFVPGDFSTDDLPTGADLAWVSAIVHMNSRQENCRLFAKVHAALNPGGSILVRDVVMDPTRTRPAMGALFAVNMLANTRGGNTFTLEELRDDLVTAGFTGVRLLHDEPSMSSVVSAAKR